jgi:hypothetical protein
MEDEVKNVLATIITSSGDAKAMVRHCGKPSRFASNITTNFNRNHPIEIVQWNCRSLRSYDRIRWALPRSLLYIHSFKKTH